MKKTGLILIILCLSCAILSAASATVPFPTDKVKKTLASINPDWVLVSWLESEVPNFWSLILRDKEKSAVGTETILSLYYADTESGKRWMLYGHYEDDYFWIYLDEDYISKRRETDIETISTRLESMCKILRNDFIMPFSMGGANRILEQVTREFVASNLNFGFLNFPPEEALADTSFVELMADNGDWIDQYEMDFTEAYGFSNDKPSMYLHEDEATYFVHSVNGRTVVLMAIGSVAQKGQYPKLICYFDLVTGTHKLKTLSSKTNGEAGDWSLPKD